MKHLILLLSICYSAIVLAQPIIKVEPANLSKTFEADLSDFGLMLGMHTKVTNLTNQEIQLRWTRTVLNKPGEWLTQVCDNVRCYNPPVSTNIDLQIGINEPVILGPNGSFDLTLYVVPSGVTGEGAFEINLALASNPAAILAKAGFSATVNALTTSTYEARKVEIRIFPNPATEYFEITNNTLVDRVTVYNLLGREVRSYRTFDRGQYSLAGLPEGMYLVSLIDNKGSVIKTMRLAKRSWRP